MKLKVRPLVERLRIKADIIEAGGVIPPLSEALLMDEAADEIERLEMEIYRLKKIIVKKSTYGA